MTWSKCNPKPSAFVNALLKGLMYLFFKGHLTSQLRRRLSNTAFFGLRVRLLIPLIALRAILRTLFEKKRMQKPLGLKLQMLLLGLLEETSF